MPQGDWLYDNSANKFNNTYFRDYNNTGFAVDMSGDLIVRGTIRNDDTGAVDMSGDLVVRNGKVGIGTTSPSSQLHVQTGGFNTGMRITTSEGTFLTSLDYNHVFFDNADDGGFSWRVNSSEKMRITDGGNVGIGTSSPASKLTVNGLTIRHESTYGTAQWFTHDDNKYVLFYRNRDKIYIRDDSGLAVDNFTGQHRTFVEHILHADASNNVGLIVCANKNKYVSMSNETKKGNQAITQNESLPIVSLSTISKDKSCFGVISESEDPESRGVSVASVFFPAEKEVGDTRIFINSLGEGAIWVSNKNGPLESGDYITTSDIPGYGEKQDSEFLANYTVAKITMDCDFNPQLQPREIILKEAVVDDSGNTVYNNVLDANGEIQWTPELDSDGNVVQEYPYNLRYLDLQGNRLTKAEYDTKLANGEQVHIAAYVGCTYHCG